jgi:tRNA1(Val) A37 N6-methylase TrmN6
MDSARNSWLLSWVARSHQSFVFGRRVRVLAQFLTAMVSGNSSLLDIGCGDGSIASLIQSAVPSLQIQGIEIAEPCLPNPLSFL